MVVAVDADYRCTASPGVADQTPASEVLALRVVAPRDAPRVPDIHVQSAKNHIRLELRRPLDSSVAEVSADQESGTRSTSR